MITADHAALMARYNAWMNARLYALCATLPEATLQEDRGAFFGSIQRSLEHIAVSDRSFLAWFTGAHFPAADRVASGLAPFHTLRAAREELDSRIQDWAATLDADELARPITYTSGLDGRPRTVPKWALVTHMFNHQTHHRGQVTTLLSQRGLDIGSTDLPFLPEFASPGGEPG